jgi:hypothetical protein
MQEETRKIKKQCGCVEISVWKQPWCGIDSLENLCKESEWVECCTLHGGSRKYEGDIQNEYEIKMSRVEELEILLEKAKKELDIAKKNLPITEESSFARPKQSREPGIV